MLKFCAALLLSVTLVLPCPSGALAQARERIALVIGNGGYQAVSTLPNPRRDADALSETLHGLGFQVTKAVDADQDAMRAAVNQFGADLHRAGPNALGFFFYAGHAVQVQGANYLIPTDAAIRDESELTRQGVHLAEIALQMKNAGISVSFMVIDACRNNPFEGRFVIPSGLAQVRAPRGSIIAYSTEPGAVALDGEGLNSPYTAALLAEIAEPGVPVELMFKRVRRRLLDSTALQQISWESSSLTEDIFFVAGSESDPVPEAGQSDHPKHEIDWEALDWGDLTAQQKDNWATLGWQAASWDGAAPEPASETLIWNNLSPTQQQAAVALGYTKPMWDGTAVLPDLPEIPNTPATPEMPQAIAVDWETLDWSDMSPAQQANWAALGWNAARWEGNAPAADTESKAWAALNAAEQAAARALGFSQPSWDKNR